MIPRCVISLGMLMSLRALGGFSQNYTLELSALDNGGSLGDSANYAADFSNTHGGAGRSINYSNRMGYSGQLAEVVDMQVIATSAPITMNEGGTRQLAAVLTYDDASLAVPAAERLTWSVSSGAALSIGTAGLVTAGSVYRDTAVEVYAAYPNFADTLGLTILNTGNDDFGNYAADGLPDTWQVQYFGESGSQGVATADGDSDGLNNLQEYAFGMNPSQGSASAVAWNGSTLQSAGTPIAFASGSASSFTFRAVFARRLDYLTAHLTYAVEFSADLVTWKASTSTPTVLAADGQVQAVSVPYPFSVNGKKAKFFRVKVQSQP